MLAAVLLAVPLILDHRGFQPPRTTQNPDRCPALHVELPKLKSTPTYRATQAQHSIQYVLSLATENHPAMLHLPCRSVTTKVHLHVVKQVITSCGHMPPAVPITLQPVLTNLQSLIKAAATAASWHAHQPSARLPHTQAATAAQLRLLRTALLPCTSAAAACLDDAPAAQVVQDLCG